MANRESVAKKVAQKRGIPAAEANATLGATIEAMKEILRSGEEVQFIGLGTFKPKTTAARKGRNPRTGETINIPARVVVRFKASKKLLSE